MAAFMAWVHRKEKPKIESLILSTIAVTLILAFLVVVEFSNTDDKLSDGQSKNEIIVAQPISLSCFDTATATVQVTEEEICPIGFISLGDTALLQITDSQSVTTEIHPILLQRFEAAYIAAKREGVNLYITSGFRSLSRQEVLFERAVKKYGDETEAAKWVLPAPYSHHPQGLAIDVNYPGDRPGAKWLELNGSRFGLCRVYANEWWHFEGVIAPGEDCPALAPNALVDLR
jgi:LAS superfamily LD-carboxypeptidase LdcB